MDPKTARKYRRLARLPREVRMPQSRRTHPDPFADVWTGVADRLALNPGLEALTLFQQLQREHPGTFPDGQLRTFQRRVKIWRATDGPAKEVFFAQVHTPGRLCASDFTHMTTLGVTINGQPFDHLIYHFVLTYSNWETGTVCFAESFETLAEGLQNALAELGGVPAVHRTDRLTAAIPPGTTGAEFTQRYRELLAHYGLEGQAIQAGHGNENGDVEQRHHRFKRALDQQLMLRGSRDFTSRASYESFHRDLFQQLNANRGEKKTLEMKPLRALPGRRFESAGRVQVKVSAGSTVRVHENTYSVSSRLIGERVEVRLHAEHVEVWYAQKLMERMPRLRGRGQHRIHDRHVIDWLVRKPGAFAEYRYGEDLFPTTTFRITYDVLRSRLPQRADKEYLRLLHHAARDSEVSVEAAIRVVLAGDGIPTADTVLARMSVEEGEEQPGRQGRHPPAVLHHEHLPAAADVFEFEDVQGAGLDFLLHGEGRQDGHPDAPEDGLLDGLVAAEFEGDPEFGQRPPRTLQRLLEAVPQPGPGLPHDQRVGRELIGHHLLLLAQRVSGWSHQHHAVGGEEAERQVGVVGLLPD
jgi:hypothetical protein